MIYVWHSEQSSEESVFSFTFSWVLETKLRLPGLLDKHLYLPSYSAGSTSDSYSKSSDKGKDNSLQKSKINRSCGKLKRRLINHKKNIQFLIKFLPWIISQLPVIKIQV